MYSTSDEAARDTDHNSSARSRTASRFSTGTVAGECQIHDRARIRNRSDIETLRLGSRVLSTRVAARLGYVCIIMIIDMVHVDCSRRSRFRVELT